MKQNKVVWLLVVLLFLIKSNSSNYTHDNNQLVGWKVKFDESSGSSTDEQQICKHNAHITINDRIITGNFFEITFIKTTPQQVIACCQCFIINIRQDIELFTVGEITGRDTYEKNIEIDINTETSVTLPYTPYVEPFTNPSTVSVSNGWFSSRTCCSMSLDLVKLRLDKLI